MFRSSAARVAIVILLLLLCSACRHPKETKTASASMQKSAGEASDINYIGGGTQIPDIKPPEEPYQSPGMTIKPDPTHITWVSDINAAVRMADKDHSLKIIAWARNDKCADCVNIERDIFTDPDVAKAAENWLFVKMDTEINKERAEYYFSGADPPAMVFLDRQGHVYNRYTGVFTKEELISMLQTWD